MQRDGYHGEALNEGFSRRVMLRRVLATGSMLGMAPALYGCGVDEAEQTVFVPGEVTPGEQAEFRRVTPPPLEPEEVVATPVGTPGATPVPAATPVSAETPGATPVATPGATPQAGRHLVEMNDELEFVPTRLTLRAGDTVVWRTVGTIPHTSTCDEDEASNPEEHVRRPEGAEPWNSGIVEQGEEYSRVFTVPGEYTYFCIPHEAAGMIGYLTVGGETMAVVVEKQSIAGGPIQRFDELGSL